MTVRARMVVYACMAKGWHPGQKLCLPTPPTRSTRSTPWPQLRIARALVLCSGLLPSRDRHRNAVTVSLTCKASHGRTVKGQVCAGSFTLRVAGHTLRHTFRFKSGKTDRVNLKLTKPVRAVAVAVARRHTKKHTITGKLTITTKLSGKKTHLARGALTIRA